MIFKHVRLFSLMAGSAVVSVWTLLRHITNGVNFDVVGQIGLAQQWAEGLHSGAQLGATNYVLKMPLYWGVNAIDILSPMHKLLILAVICNVATFILLFLLSEKILKHFAVTDLKWLYLGMLWLACIAGNIFWVDYANSRNLEVVGGLLFVYLVLRYIKVSSWQRAVIAAVAGSIVFFADSLQFYVCGVGLCAYVVFEWLRTRQRHTAGIAGGVVAITAAAFVGSKLLSELIANWLHLSFLTAPRQPVDLGLHTIGHTIKNLGSSTLDVFGANVFKQPFTANSVRELFGFVVLIGLILAIIKYKPNPRIKSFYWVGLAIIAVNYAVYFASGQVTVWATSRYVIMVPIMCVLVFASVQPPVTKALPTKLWFSWLTVSAICGVLLLGAVLVKWHDRHAKDTHIIATVAYLDAQHAKYALSSRENGVTVTFFSEGRTPVLPLLCLPNQRLVFTDLFYDREPYERFKNSDITVPLIVPVGGITSGASVCDGAAVLAQFGAPAEATFVEGIGTIMQYPAEQLQAQL